MPRVLVLATGGTISSRSGLGGSVASDGAAELVGQNVGRVPGVDVEAVDVLRKNSFNFDLADLRRICSTVIESLGRDDVDAAVVTHGTDTLEETVFLLDLVYGGIKPVVFTGAQRGADQPASDGPGNLLDALLTAASPLARGKGVLVSFAGEIFAARGIQKGHTVALAPFRARGTGPIGRIDNGSVRFYESPLRLPLQPAPEAGFDEVRVEIVLNYPGAGADAFRRAVDAGVQGIVVAGTGAGNPNAKMTDAIRDAVRAGIVVAIATRVPDGPALPIYGGGGAAEAVAAGAVPVGGLPFTQARILLALLLERHCPARAAELLRSLCSVC